MSYLELLGLVGVGASAIGAWLALYALINNRTLKTESRLTRELIKEMRDETGKLLDRMDKSIERGFRDVIADNAQTRSLIKTT